MKSEIRKYYSEDDYHKVLELIRSEGKEWEEYLNPAYKRNLEQSITLVTYADDVLCGYARAINDPGLFVWVIDLLVHKTFRGNSLGKAMLECLQAEFPARDIYILSDVDEYYEKLGYTREGSIFKIVV